jgi:hypothetical protein
MDLYEKIMNSPITHFLTLLGLVYMIYFGMPFLICLNNPSLIGCEEFFK